MRRARRGPLICIGPRFVFRDTTYRERVEARLRRKRFFRLKLRFTSVLDLSLIPTLNIGLSCLRIIYREDYVIRSREVALRTDFAGLSHGVLPPN
jgi:hypothetical protein